MKKLSEAEVNIITGKMLIGHEDLNERLDYMSHVNKLMTLLDQAEMDGAFQNIGGYRKALGWKDE